MDWRSEKAEMTWNCVTQDDAGLRRRLDVNLAWTKDSTWTGEAVARDTTWTLRRSDSRFENQLQLK